MSYPYDKFALRGMFFNRVDLDLNNIRPCAGTFQHAKDEESHPQMQERSSETEYKGSYANERAYS